MMDTLTCIRSRRSCSQLIEPAPTQDQLAEIVTAALNAPDHGLLRPWCLTVITDQGRSRLGECLAQAQQQQAIDSGITLTTEQLNNTRAKPLRAPMIIMVGCKILAEHKIPVIEQQLSTAALIQNLQLGLHANGFSCIWRTGPLAYHAIVKAAFGLEDKDLIAGLLYVGTAARPAAVQPDKKIADFIQYW